MKCPLVKLFQQQLLPLPWGVLGWIVPVAFGLLLPVEAQELPASQQVILEHPQNGLPKRLPIHQPVSNQIQAEPAQQFATLSHLEEQLYGVPYYEDPLAERTARIEKTLFGVVQVGLLKDRIAAIQLKAGKSSVSKSPGLSNEVILGYLEQRFFQTRFESSPLAVRVTQLEQKVFGEAGSLESLASPEEVTRRMKRLTYALPAEVKGVRLKSTTPSVNRVSVPASLTDRTLDHTLSTPVSSPVSEALFLPLPQKALRWDGFPVQVLIYAQNAQEVAWSTQAVQQWNETVPVVLTQSSELADVFIDWNGSALLHTVSTQPILHRANAGQPLRTVVWIDMASYKTQPAHLKQHGVSHQLGHALGLWGHSVQPGDVMFPMTPLEIRDIPQKWLKQFRFESSGLTTLPQVPSNQDRRILLNLYKLPSQAIEQYQPGF